MERQGTASIVCALLALTLLPACGSAREPAEESPQRRGGGVALKQVGSFEEPTYVTGAPGYPKLLFITEQSGRVVMLRDGRRLPRPFLDIRDLVQAGGEEGLLSIAFPPDYAQSRRFYVYYTDNAGDIRIDEFRSSSATRAARSSRRRVIGIPHPVNSNHNGGQLQFLDNLLFLGTGDGGAGGDPPNNAQNKESLLGKLLRIDPRARGGRPYTVPSDNPFVGRAGRDEIYSLGLRNPYRFSFDTTGDQPRIAIGDVGQDRFEELDYTTVGEAKGANFGWDAFEGKSRYTGAESGTPNPGGTTKPIMAYGRGRDSGSCTIIGGYVIRDPRLPALRGRYLYADFCAGKLRSLIPDLRGAKNDRPLGLEVALPTSFGEDSRGRIYVASQEGPLYRLVRR